MTRKYVMTIWITNFLLLQALLRQCMDDITALLRYTPPQEEEIAEEEVPAKPLSKKEKRQQEQEQEEADQVSRVPARNLLFLSKPLDVSGANVIFGLFSI